jgi:uncharacterized protein YxjI
LEEVLQVVQVQVVHQELAVVLEHQAVQVHQGLVVVLEHQAVQVHQELVVVLDLVELQVHQEQVVVLVHQVEMVYRREEFIISINQKIVMLLDIKFYPKIQHQVEFKRLLFRY